METKTVKKLSAAAQRIYDRMPPEQPIGDVAELFKTFGDPTRARILCALRIGEVCVGDLAAVLDMSQSAVSHQLRVLKSVRLVRSRKAGKTVYYALDDAHIAALFEMAFAHVTEKQEG